MNELIINGITYIKKEEADPLDYKIIRTYSAGVFMAKVVSKKAEANGVNAVLKDAYRIWCWFGAASLSQLALEGVKDKTQTKIALPIRVEVNNIIEIIDMTKEAIDNLKSISPWEK